MPDVIFARPRYVYDSYSDLYTLITLSNYPLIYFDEIDPYSDNLYLLTVVNGEIEQGWQDPTARIILLDLEWRLDGRYPRIPGVSHTFASDLWYAEQIGAAYVPLGSHPGLNPAHDDQADKAYDVAMLSYMTNRRMQMRAWLLDRDVSIAPNGWGQDRHRILLQSRAMLHVHQNDNVPTIAPLRFALAAAYKLPLISESVCKPGMYRDAVLWADYDKLADVVRDRVSDNLQGYGDALYELLCVERTFRRNIEEAL